jgi:hypothetical protein
MISTLTVAMLAFLSLTSQHPAGEPVHSVDAQRQELETRIVNLERQRQDIETQLAAARADLRTLLDPTQAATMESAAAKPFYLRVGDGELRIRQYWHTVYLLTDGPSRIFPSFYQVNYKASGHIQSDVAGYFNVNGKPSKLVYTSRNEKLLKLFDMDNGQTTFQFLGPGVAELMVSLAGESTSLRINVVALPVQQGMTSAKAIALLGLPAATTTDYISWPESKSIDQVAYRPSAQQGTLEIEHWQFEAYPNVALAFCDGKVFGVGFKEKRFSFEDSPMDVEYKLWSARK